jgi:hypothetical protein
MRGDDQKQTAMFSYLTLAQRIPAAHPARQIRVLVDQLSKGHRQILVAAGEAPMVRISAIALDTLLELVRGQVIQELEEDGLSSVHPSLLTIADASGHPALAPGSAAINFKSKNESYTLSRVICDRYSEQPDFSRTLLSQHVCSTKYFR